MNKNHVSGMGDSLQGKAQGVKGDITGDPVDSLQGMGNEAWGGMQQGYGDLQDSMGGRGSATMSHTGGGMGGNMDMDMLRGFVRENQQLLKYAAYGLLAMWAFKKAAHTEWAEAMKEEMQGRRLKMQGEAMIQRARARRHMSDMDDIVDD